MNRNSPSILPLLPGLAGFTAAAVFLAIGLSGCTTEVVNNYYLDEEVVDDSGNTDTASSEDDVEHIGSPDVDDTAVEDTATEPVCEFVVNTWDGEIVMGNNLTVALNQDTPSGQILPGTNDMLVLDFTAQDPDCADILVVGFSIKVLWTDNAGTGWYPTWLGMSIDDELVTGTGLNGGFAGGTTNYVGISHAFVVPAGDTVTAVFSAEMIGASAVDDDSVLFGLYTGSLVIYDGTGVPRTLHNEMLDGFSLVF